MKKTLKKGIASTAVEQGFLLGCSEDIYLIDRVSIAPCKYSKATEFVVDAQLANEFIAKWSKEGVLFCGVVHSHVGGSTVFSEEDQRFVKMLHENFNLPFIWFGLISGQDGQNIMILKMVHKGFADLNSLSSCKFNL